MMTDILPIYPSSDPFSLNMLIYPKLVLNLAK